MIPNKQYRVTAGNANTDLGIVGYANTILGAKRIGRRAVSESLPNGEGNYNVRTDVGYCVLHGEYGSRTNFKWIEDADHA